MKGCNIKSINLSFSLPNKIYQNKAIGAVTIMEKAQITVIGIHTVNTIINKILFNMILRFLPIYAQ